MVFAIAFIDLISWFFLIYLLNIINKKTNYEKNIYTFFTCNFIFMLK